MTGFRLYMPNSKRLALLHYDIANSSQNFHLRSILKNNWDLFLADSIHLLTIMLAENQYQYEDLTDSQCDRLIQNSLHEFIPVMESTIMHDIEECASALSGRDNAHAYTLDMVESMVSDYESWLTNKYRHDDKSVICLLIESLMQEHLNHNVPGLIHNVNKYNTEKLFPDLHISTASPRQMLLQVNW